MVLWRENFSCAFRNKTIAVGGSFVTRVFIGNYYFKDHISNGIASCVRVFCVPQQTMKDNSFPN